MADLVRVDANLEKRVRMRLPHDFTFCDEALKLASGGIKESEGHYRFKTDSPVYFTFLNFMIGEFRHINDEKTVGERIAMREDSWMVLKALHEYLMTQKTEMEWGYPWNSDRYLVKQSFLGVPEQMLEVFKTQVYEDSRNPALCYSLDLSAYGDGYPRGFVLDRFHVYPKGGSLDLFSAGTVEVLFDTGTFFVDVNQNRMKNIHLKPSAQKADVLPEWFGPLFEEPVE